MQQHCGDALRQPLAMVMFDSAVNSGVRQAIMWLQDALSVSVDGIMGPETSGALEGADPQGAAKEVLARRIDFLARLPTWPHFGLGWSRRIANLAFASVQSA
jgi:lysozyme family protein